MGVFSKVGLAQVPRSWLHRRAPTSFSVRSPPTTKVGVNITKEFVGDMFIPQKLLWLNKFAKLWVK